MKAVRLSIEVPQIKYIFLFFALCNIISEFVPDAHISYKLEEAIHDRGETFRSELKNVFNRSDKISGDIFQNITVSYFENISNSIIDLLRNISSLQEISESENALYKFCGKYCIANNIHTSQTRRTSAIESAILGENYELVRQDRLRSDRCISTIKNSNYADSLIVLNGNEKRPDAQFYIQGDPDFEQYCRKNSLRNKISSDYCSIIAILNDKSLLWDILGDADLVFTSKYLILLKINKEIKTSSLYSTIKLEADRSGKHKISINGMSYYHKNVDSNLLFELIERLGAITRSTANDSSMELALEIEQKINNAFIEYPI